MGWESFGVVRFDLVQGWIFSGQKLFFLGQWINLDKTPLLLILEVWNVKPTHRKSWAGNLLMLLDLTLGSSFKVKQWFTGFGELSFQWIQICINALMRRTVICTFT